MTTSFGIKDCYLMDMKPARREALIQLIEYCERSILDGSWSYEHRQELSTFKNQIKGLRG